METKLHTLTKEGVIKLEQELKVLKEEERPRVLEALKEARAQGDLSENADYDAARDEQGRIEQRIVEIEHILKNVDIINESKFLVHFVEENVDEEIYLVGSQEIDPDKKRISVESPLGKVLNSALNSRLLNKPLKVKTEVGEFNIIIKKIS